LTRWRLEPMIYHTQGEHAGHLWKKLMVTVYELMS
jgi:hypothetical protein